MYDLKTYRTFKRRAFTLVEILAAMSLFAVMMVGIASVLGQTNVLTERLKSRQSSVAAAQLGLERIEKDLLNAFDEKIQRSPSLFKATEGTSGFELSFSYLESPIFPLFINRTAGLRIASYSIEKDENGSLALFRKDIPYYEFRDLELVEGEKIATGILEWTMEYYDPRNSQWIKDWDDKGRYTGGYFPTAVKIFVRATDPNLPADERETRARSFQTAFILLNEITESR